jgi:hypothetical protein
MTFVSPPSERNERWGESGEAGRGVLGGVPEGGRGVLGESGGARTLWVSDQRDPSVATSPLW